MSRIPYGVPRPAQLPERLDAVLAVVYLLFTTGHTAPAGPDLVRVDLADGALRLARMLLELMPDEAEVRGLLALLLLTDARRAARLSDTGRLLRLEEQDRSRWNSSAIAEGRELVAAALAGHRAGRYALQAAIAAVYVEAPSYAATDWRRVLTLYDRLFEAWPTPVVALNRAVPLAQVAGPAVALAEVEAIESDGLLEGYQYLPAVKAELLSRLGRTRAAAAAYRQALAVTSNTAERRFLTERIDRLETTV